MLVAAAVTAAYSATSGLWGVVVTDLMLFVIAMVGSVAAAWYALAHPAVGGLDGLVSHPDIASRLALLPDFADWRTAATVFLIPIAVQWWSTWYPGAEPGGGGYAAQRMLAARSERDSMGATLWFNIAHYALRPWPWILVALASLVVYPTLDSIAEAFPHLDPSIVRHDLAYPAMLVFLPHGLLGLVVASLAAALMSTISTHLKLGRLLHRRRRVPPLRPAWAGRVALRPGRPAVHDRPGGAGGSRRPVARERDAGVPDPAPDRGRHGPDLPVALVLVADQRLVGDLGDGRLVRSRPCGSSSSTRG